MKTSKTTTPAAPTPKELYETPWNVTYDDADGFYSLRSYIGQRIAKVITQDVELPSTIVRAVNSHEELVKYVKDNHRIHMGKSHDAMVARKGFCTTCNLIARAEGKQS